MYLPFGTIGAENQRLTRFIHSDWFHNSQPARQQTNDVATASFYHKLPSVFSVNLTIESENEKRDEKKKFTKIERRRTYD